MYLTKDDLQAIKQIVDGAIEGSKQHTAAGFAEMDERFARIDERFAQVDERFEQIDARFEQIDERFAQIDEQLADMRSDIRSVQDRADQIARVQQAEVKRVDTYDKTLSNIRKTLHTV